MVLAFVLLLSISGCFSHKSLAKHFLDGDELAYQLSRKSSNAYHKARKTTQAVSLIANHDYFRTGDHVRWKNDYQFSIDTLHFEHCPFPFEKVELGTLDILWKMDSISIAEVNTRHTLGKQVPTKAFAQSAKVVDSSVKLPQRFVLDFGETIRVGDTLFWNGSNHSKDRVLMTIECDGCRTLELIMKDNGQYVINKRLLTFLESADYVTISIYRAKAQRFDVGDKLNRSLGLFYLEKASTTVNVAKNDF